MGDAEVYAVVIGGAMSFGWLAKMVVDRLKNGKPTNNGEYAKAQLGKLDAILAAHLENNLLQKQLCEGTKEHFKEARHMTERVIENIWRASPIAKEGKYRG